MANPAEYLYEGSTGEDVKSLQLMLKAQGYAVGEIDGEFGPITKSAVEAYQRDNGLKVDGIVGPETETSMSQEAAIIYDEEVLTGLRGNLIDKVNKIIADADETVTDVTTKADIIISENKDNLDVLNKVVMDRIVKPVTDLGKVSEDLHDVGVLTTYDAGLTLAGLTPLVKSEIVNDTRKIEIDIKIAQNTVQANINETLKIVGDNLKEWGTKIGASVKEGLEDAHKVVDDLVKPLLDKYQPLIDKLTILTGFLGEVSDFLFDEMLTLLKGALEWKEEDLPGIIETVFVTLQNISAQLAIRKASEV